MEYYSAVKKSEIMPFVTMWVDLESIMFSEINHPEKDKYSVITYLWNLKKKKKKEMNVYNKTDTENKPVVTSRERERGGPR